MKRILTLLLIAGLCSAAPAQVKTDQDRAGLLGPVKSVKKEFAEFTPKAAEGRRVPVRADTYDVRGNLVERADFNPDGSVAQRLVYAFDAQGRATGYEEYAAGLSAPRRHVYVLDGEGRRAEYRIVQPDGSAGEKYLYKYDARGNVAEEALQDHKGVLISRNVYAYDEQGRQISQTRYNADGSVSSVGRSTYDAQGRPAERVRHEGEVLTYRVRYAYDSAGRVVERETTGSVVEPDLPGGEAHAPGRVVYAYKGQARPREATVYAPDGSIREKIRFEYDSRGNWIRKTHLPLAAAGATRRVEYRTITYF